MRKKNYVSFFEYLYVQIGIRTRWISSSKTKNYYRFETEYSNLNFNIKSIFCCFFITLFFAFTVSAQTPTVIASGTFSASGSGATGIPTMNFNIPAGKNRLMVISVVFERYHNPYNSNLHVGADGSTSGIAPIVVVGGVTTTAGINNFARLVESSGNNGTLRFSTNYNVRYLSDSQGLPTGNVSVNFNNVNLPESAGDEVAVAITVFENANQTPLFVDYESNDGFNTSANFITVNGTAQAIPVGNTISNILYYGSGMLSQQKTITTSAGWTINNSVVVNNTGGSTVSSSSAANEPDGISLNTFYRTIASGNPSFSLSRAASNPVTMRGAGYLYAVFPLAKPSITGNVFSDTDGATNINGTGTNAGGIYVNVINSIGNLVYSAAVNASGLFSVPTGFVEEESIYTLELSKNTGTIGNPAPIKVLPSGYGTVGESTSATPFPNDGTNDGIINLTIGTTNITGLRYGVNSCAAGNTAPALTAVTKSNICPSTTADLTTITATNQSSGLILTWHTGSVATDTNRIADPAAVGSGTYYAAFYSTAGGCYSTVTSAVTVTVNSCPTPFPCDNTAYLTKGLSTNGELFRHNLLTGITNPTPFVSFGTLANALAYNPIDNTLWLLVTQVPIATTKPKLTRVDGSGVITTFTIPNLDAALGINPTSATITATGYYVAKVSSSPLGAIGGGSNATDGDNYVVVDVNPSRATYLQVVDPANGYAVATAPYYKETVGNAFINMSDFAYNSADGLLYGMSSAGKLSTLNITTGTFTVGNEVTLPSGSIAPAGTYATSYIDGTGSLYEISSASTYRIKIPSGNAVLLSQGVAGTNMDGANCLTAIVAYAVQGKVYDDANGDTDNIINGIQTNLGNTLNAILYNNTTNTVSAVTAVAANGAYAFGANPGNNYTVYITTNTATVGQSAVPIVALPSNWVHTQENNCGTNPSCTGTDFNPDGTLSLGTVSSDISEANFGVDNLPVTTNASSVCQVNPGGSVQVVAPLLMGSDLEDQPISGSLEGMSLHIISLPSNGALYYAGTQILPADLPVVITGYQMADLTVDPNDNITTLTFIYQYIDAAQLAGSIATATMCFTTGSCYKPGATGGTVLDTQHGITALGRAGSDNDNWPMLRKGAWTVLEAKTKGFVINRLTDSQITLIPAGQLVEGMMLYNITQDCLQVNTDGTTTGWKCFNTQTCPD